MVAGVAGGIGEYLGVDPVLLRVVFAVLTVFGGLGVLLYLMCWLVMPTRGEQFSPFDTVLGRGSRRRTGLTGETLLLVSAAVVLALFLVRHDGADYVLLAVLVIIGLLVYRHLESQGPPPGTDATTPPPGTPGTHGMAGPSGPTGPSEPPGASGAAGTAGTAGFATWSTTRPWPTDPRPPHRTGGRTETVRRRSGLGIVGLCLALILGGLLVGLHQGTGVDLSRRSFLALVLALVGATLVVGTWWGRARSLILLGVPLAVVLVVAGDPLLSDWSAREQTWAPASVGELAGSYELGAGRGLLDLRDVDFTETDRTIAVELGAGELRIELPPNVDVQADGRVKVGSMDLFGSFTNGVKQARSVFDDGFDGPGGGRLEILAAVDFGRLEVVR